MESLTIVLVTCPDEEVAKNIARPIIEQRLAACVNIIPKISSIYRWKGKICEEGECLLLIKVGESKLQALEKEIMARHPYELPEFVVIRPITVAAKYLAWALES